MAIPQISVVAVGRNDNYGGDFKARLQSFITWTFGQLTKQKIQSELIFVNYNPLDTEPPIESFISWPVSNEWVTLRIITIPHQIHAETVSKFDLKDVPVLEYVAKNIGIRRANGHFVLAMNPDILLAESLFNKFKNLSQNRYYRTNRLDHNGSLSIDTKRSLYYQLKSSVNTIWFKGSNVNVKSFTMSTYRYQWLKKTLQNWWRIHTVRLRPILNFLSIPVYYDNLEYRFHSNASGDFMLMSKLNWEKLQGYKEDSHISLHVDSLMVFQAAFFGLKEWVFSDLIFHKAHARRYDAINKETEDQHAAFKGFRKDLEIMASSKKPILYNDEHWGMATEIFDEYNG